MSELVSGGGEFGVPDEGDTRGMSRVKFALVSMAAIAGVAAALYPFTVVDAVDVATGKDATETQLSNATTSLFGGWAVRCSDFPGSWRDVFVQPTARTEHLPLGGTYFKLIHMRTNACDAAVGTSRGALYTDQTRLHAASTAVLALSFEGQRVQNVHDDGTALCQATQRARQLMEDIGATVPVMDQVSSDIYSGLKSGALKQFDGMHVPDGCHDGGSLDLDPNNTNPATYFPPAS